MAPGLGMRICGLTLVWRLRARALENELGDLKLAVAGRDDLISMKRPSAPPVDDLDLAALTVPDDEKAGG